MLLTTVSSCSSEPSIDNTQVVEEPTDGFNRDSQDEKIESSIQNSYARLASKRSDICPKLIQKEVDTQVVERNSEVMVNSYCDYFLYPTEGQDISVSVNDRRIEALLIIPTIYDFANGDYAVESYDKHVIRLSYDGATYKPANLVYDVVVTVSEN
ncbi:MAG: hypothetical protein ACTHYX_03600 [Psychrobacter sp.]|uniref:hypothetical protein n=1 Tax=Psychrobacter sp. TaxID=56811 RepID=UPI0026476E55|nr:hypothetical protein [Psychrobacter sp.]MDN6275613.1 hypothetical protein [Psychrobacter sp.]MDN6308022.1 hypothetical protein [Psychrobacter sp.]